MTSCTAPDKNCDLCPRLAKFRAGNRKSFPDKFNAPVPSFGAEDPALLIVGLAPGLRGANFSGRPFTGDYAGDLLYPTLAKFGYAKGVFDRRIDDGLTLINTRITNAVRCVPPENKPTPAEINRCRPFLDSELNSFKKLKVIVALGTIAHNSILKTLAMPLSKYKFGHGAVHALGRVTLLDSYHCSRYNVNTRRLTPEMFETVIGSIKKYL